MSADFDSDPLFKLHMDLINLCASGVITETEHTMFEDVLNDVLGRKLAESE